MKIDWIIGSLLVVLIIVISAGLVADKMTDQNNTGNISTEAIEQQSSQHLSQSSAIIGSRSYAITLDLPAKASQERILVYKTSPPDVSRKRLEEFARVFRVNGTFSEGKRGMVIYTDDRVQSIEIEKASGTVIYTVVGRPDDILDSPDILPSDEDAARIATQFLKENHLYPDGAYIRKTERHYETGTDKNGNEVQYAGQIEVWFGRKLNNLEVWGTQLSVDVGGNGDIIGYYANWREYTPDGEYSLKTPKTAFEDLKQKGIETEIRTSSISITDASLAYRTKAGAYTEEYLEPIWIFSGTASTGNKESQPVDKFIPALTDESVKSLSK